MFQGFTAETDAFFMAIRFNNNMTFFHENHDWYERAVRTPMKELAADLSGTVDALDPRLETRPERVVSRINRDIRFSRDKSPYRDYMWLSFHPPKDEACAGVSVYFDISDTASSFGLAFSRDPRPLTDALRRDLARDPAPFLAVAEETLKHFSLRGTDFRRLRLPDSLPPPLKAWYIKKEFYLQRDLSRGDISSPALVDIIADGIGKLGPVYRYLTRVEL